ncbi:MAG: zinc ribbon domain-containing protein [Anaerolineae bacterium]
MPIYEYGCYDCKKRVNIFWRSFADAERGDPRCPRCGGRNIKRLVSRVATLRSEESRLESLADPANLAGLDEDDPQSLAKWMKHMSSEAGEDLGPEFGEVVNRLEAGQSPEEIEQEMPDLADGLPGGAGAGGADDDWFG